MGRAIGVHPWAATILGGTLAGATFAQGYKVNLPLPPDPGFGGGDVFVFELSPDGTRLAYAANQELVTETNHYVAASDGSRLAHRITPPFQAHGFVNRYAFAPDSRWVLFTGDPEVDGRQELFSAPADGSGPGVRLHAAPVEGGDVGDLFLVSVPTQRVVFGGDLEVDGQFQVYSAPLDGSSPAVVLNGPLAPDQDASHEFFLLTPDGNRLLYFSNEAGGGVQDLWSVPVDGSPGRIRVLPGMPNQGIGGEGGTSMRFAPDGSTLVFRGDLRVAGQYELFRVPLDGSTAPLPLLAPQLGFADVQQFDLTPDDAWAVFRADLHVDGVIGLWSVPLDGSAPVRRLSGRLPRFADVDGSVTLDGPFQITPDGKWVVFCSDRTANDRFELWGVPVDGHAPAVRLTPLEPGGGVTGYRLTRDGEQVVYSGKRGAFDPQELFVVGVRGGTPRRLNADLVASGRVERDFLVGAGHVVFRADAELDERFELFAAALDETLPGPVRLHPPLADGSDVEPRFRLTPDGGHVLYLADLATPRQKEVFRSPVDGSAPPRVVSGELTIGPPVGDVYGFGFAGRRILYTGSQDLPQVFEAFAVSLDGAPERLVLHDHETTGGQVQWPRTTPDGERLVYVCDAHVLQQYELFSVPADGSTPPVELSGTITPIGGDVYEDFHFTPDGARVVFRGNLDDVNVSELYSAPVDGSLPQVKLSGPLGGLRDVEPDLYFSPDSRWVLYRADQEVNDRIELYVVPVDGSLPPLKLNGPLIAEGDVSGDPFTEGDEVRVTADSSRVIFGADQAIDQVLEVFSVPLTGGMPVRLHAPLGPDRDAVLADLTPDGQRVLFRSTEAVRDSFDLYSVPSDGSLPPLRVSQAFLFGGGVRRARVVPDGTRVVYNASKDPNGRPGLFSARLDGGAPLEIGHPDHAPQDTIVTFLLTPDGRRAVYLAGSPQRLYVAWVDGSRPALVLDEFHSAADLTLAASDELLYRARAFNAAGMQLHRVPLDGGRPPELLHPELPFGREVTGLALDTSGTRVLYRADQDTNDEFELYLVFLGPRYRRSP